MASVRCQRPASASGACVLVPVPGATSSPSPRRTGCVAVSRLPAVLDQIDLIDLDQRIRMLARMVTPTTVRSLDAIHLGTALRSRPSLTSFVTYDKRLLDAAQATGLPIGSGHIRGMIPIAAMTSSPAR